MTPMPYCQNLPADYGEPAAVRPSCSDDLYDLWEQRCPAAKLKTLLVAMTGGLLMGMARGAGGYGATDTGRYKGYKTYDSTYRSQYGTTRCRTQMSDGKSYTSCD